MIKDKYKSPNYNNRVDGSKIDYIIIHYTGVNAPSQSIIKWFLDPLSKVSCHYFIDNNGTIYSLVNDYFRAWHAGKSYWNGCRDINSQSIGIELHNSGIEDFSGDQINALLKLLKLLISKHSIERHNILGHSDVSVGRKIDPGIKFPWQFLNRSGIGVYSEMGYTKKSISIIKMADQTKPTIMSYQKKLIEIGFELSVSGIIDEQTKKVVVAFQTHWRSELVDGKIDQNTISVIDDIHRKITDARNLKLEN
ncbi:MAG: N-acetylmuramoyl-L-alanine amidase [Rhizobiales bacterium]|nr:N-acetylmuramoyl-L-alanine amidase [Hyphomicrobiales bacterium]MBL6770346.1 N-acetylmuramoyl-L-alanine amidase [Hyphomicrobiales bacterium]